MAEVHTQAGRTVAAAGPAAVEVAVAVAGIAAAAECGSAVAVAGTDLAAACGSAGMEIGSASVAED